MNKYKYPLYSIIAAVILAMLMSLIHPRKRYTVVELRRMK